MVHDREAHRSMRRELGGFGQSRGRGEFGGGAGCSRGGGWSCGGCDGLRFGDDGGWCLGFGGDGEVVVVDGYVLL